MTTLSIICFLELLFLIEFFTLLRRPVGRSLKGAVTVVVPALDAR